MQRRSSRIETVESSDESDVEDMDMALASEHPYDIVYKFEQQQKSSFFKQAKKTYPMYPYVEEKIKWDDYGEIIRPEDYMLVEAVLPGTGSTVADLKRERELGDSSMDMEDQTRNAEIPSKCIISKTKLEVLCQVDFIDFEGRSDGESVKKLLNQIKPKQLIIVHGTVEGTRHLAAYAEQHGIAPGRIFTPRLGDTVDATIESHIFQVTLTDVLMSSLEFQPVKDAELAWVDARLSVRKSVGPKIMGIQQEPKKYIPGKSFEDLVRKVTAGTRNADLALPVEQAEMEKEQEEHMEQTSTCLDNLPYNAIPPHVAVFVNDPKLSDLKQLLMLNGFQAEFSGGVLYVNNVVSIRRNEAGRFHLEGCTSDDYYKIRDLVYRQYAIV